MNITADKEKILNVVSTLIVTGLVTLMMNAIGTLTKEYTAVKESYAELRSEFNTVRQRLDKHRDRLEKLEQGKRR